MLAEYLLFAISNSLTGTFVNSEDPGEMPQSGKFYSKQLMSMTMKCHNHTLRTNPRNHEKEPETTNSHTPSESKVTSFLFLSKMIAKLERTLSTAIQNIDQTQIHTDNGINYKH